MESLRETSLKISMCRSSKIYFRDHDGLQSCWPKLRMAHKMVAAKAKSCKCEIQGDGRGLGSSMQLWPPVLFTFLRCRGHSHIKGAAAAAAEGVWRQEGV